MGRLGGIWRRGRSTAPSGADDPDSPPAAGATTNEPSGTGDSAAPEGTPAGGKAPAPDGDAGSASDAGAGAGADAGGDADAAGAGGVSRVVVPAQVAASPAPDDPPASPDAASARSGDDSGSGGDARSGDDAGSKPVVEPWTGVGSRFGDPGQPLRRTSPFYIGFIGGLGLITAWILAQAVMGIQHVLIIILISFFLAAGLNPFVERLERRGLARRWAVSAVAFGFVIVVAGFATAIAQPLVEQTSNLINSIPESLTELLHNEQFKRLDEKYDIVERAKDWAANANTAQNLAGGLWGFGKMVLTSVFDTLTVIVLTLYFLGSLPRIKEYIYNLFPKTRRARVRLLGDEILSGIGGYVNGALIVATCAGLSSFVFLTVLGSEYALPLALVIAFTDLIPMIGATIGAAVVSLVVFFDSPGKALTCVIFFLAYQQFENYLVYPRVMKRAVNVPPAMTVIAALVGGALLGVTGALLAIPIAAAVLLILREVVTPRQDQA